MQCSTRFEGSWTLSSFGQLARQARADLLQLAPAEGEGGPCEGLHERADEREAHEELDLRSTRGGADGS